MSSSTQAFDVLRRDLIAMIAVKQKDQAELRAQMTKLQALLFEKQEEERQAMAILHAHEAAMQDLGLLKKTTKKAAKKVKTRTKAAKTKAVSVENAQQASGERAAKKAPKKKAKKTANAGGGGRPPLKAAMVEVMGNAQMTAADVYQSLKKKGWVKGLKNPKPYVSMLLSSNKNTFRRVSRGLYVVVPQPANIEAQPRNNRANAPVNDPITDDLVGIGINAESGVADNPFSS